jgi:hypothetical protein
VAAVTLELYPMLATQERTYRRKSVWMVVLTAAWRASHLPMLLNPSCQHLSFLTVASR